VPRPKDGEVSEFMLCDVDEVKKQLAAGEYKDNCALCVIDLFIRWEIITEETEPDLVEIGRRMYRDIPFPGPHQKNWVAKTP
jgi:hypothetical protein